MEFFGHPDYLHATEDRFSGVPGSGGMYNNAYDVGGVNALIPLEAMLLWIEGQSVFCDGNRFNIHWTCIGHRGSYA